MLRFDHIDVSYHKAPILSDISLTIPTGKITTIIGSNGCGKTTLLSTLNGTSKVTTGAIYLDDTNLLTLKTKERAKKIAFLPQVRQTIPTLPVRTLVEHGRFPHLGFARKKSDADKQIVSQVMDFTGVTPYANQYVDTLSGGIRQRVFFAMILAQDCDTIILDEPTTYLDIAGQRNFYKLLLNLKAQGKTILLVLHDLSKALSISDEIVLMNERKVLFTGTPADCVQTGLINQVFDTTCKTFSDEDGTYYIFD